MSVSYSELSPFFRAILEPVLTPVFPTCLIIKFNPRQSDRTTKTHFHCRLYAFSGFPEPVDPTVTPSPNPNIESSTTAIRYSNELTKNRNKESGQPEKQASERFSPTSNGLFRLFRPNDSSRHTFGDDRRSNDEQKPSAERSIRLNRASQHDSDRRIHFRHFPFEIIQRTPEEKLADIPARRRHRYSSEIP